MVLVSPNFIYLPAAVVRTTTANGDIHVALICVRIVWLGISIECVYKRSTSHIRAALNLNFHLFILPCTEYQSEVHRPPKSSVFTIARIEVSGAIV